MMKTISSKGFAAFCSALCEYWALGRYTFSEDDERCAEALVRVVCNAAPGSMISATPGPLSGLSVVVVGLGLPQRVFFEEPGVSPWVKAAGVTLEKFNFGSFDTLEI